MLVTSLDLYENGRKLKPLTYSNGRTQEDVVEGILEAFEDHDLVNLEAVVGSGKSAIGIKTVLEMGGGVISVHTKVLSDQYYDDYYDGDKYFLRPDGARAKIAVFKGRKNFACPLWEKKHPNVGRVEGLESAENPCRVEKTVTEIGNGAHVCLPGDWVGEDVTVLLREVEE